MPRRDNDLTIMAVGDVHVNRADPPSVFQDVAPTLNQGDIVIGNLEGPICDTGAPIIGKREIGSGHLRCSPHNAQALETAGFTMMGLANNHNMDYGSEGLLQTIAILDSMGIAHAGGGKNLAEAHAPASMEKNGVKVALLSYTSIYPPVGFAAEPSKAGLSTIKVHTSYQAPENIQYQPGFPPLVTTFPEPADMSRMMDDVSAAKKKFDLVFVAFHWGVSWGHNKIVGYQKELGRAAIDSGADLILGGHPHSLMAMEFYKEKLLCYCLGNFVMDGLNVSNYTHFGSETAILKLSVQDKRIRRISLIPAVATSTWEPKIADSLTAQKVLEKLQAMSEEFGTEFRMDGNEIVVVGARPGTPQARRGFEVEPHRGLPVLMDALLPLPYIVKKLKGWYKDEA